MSSERRKKNLSKQKREKRITALVHFLLGLFLIIIPLALLFLDAVGFEMPTNIIGSYLAIAFLVCGILFIVFSCKEKFGFSEAGTVYKWFGSWHQSKKEAKANGVAVGLILISLGVFFAVLTIIYA